MLCKPALLPHTAWAFRKRVSSAIVTARKIIILIIFRLEQLLCDPSPRWSHWLPSDNRGSLMLRSHQMRFGWQRSYRQVRNDMASLGFSGIGNRVSMSVLTISFRDSPRVASFTVQWHFCLSVTQFDDLWSCVTPRSQKVKKLQKLFTIFLIQIRRNKRK